VAGATVWGTMHAWNASASDVGQPEVTPQTGFIKYHVTGDSMSSTIRDGDWLLAKANPGHVARGDVIILRYPKDTTKVYCRRVLAMAGDHVVTKYFSNVKLTTIYNAEHPEGLSFPQGVMPHGNAYGQYETTVGANMLYVVGDNSTPGSSYDSDQWGLLPMADVTGLVQQRLSPSPRNF